MISVKDVQKVAQIAKMEHIVIVVLVSLFGKMAHAITVKIIQLDAHFVQIMVLA